MSTKINFDPPTWDHLPVYVLAVVLGIVIAFIVVFGRH